jgi:hypothetical protein
LIESATKPLFLMTHATPQGHRNDPEETLKTKTKTDSMACSVFKIIHSKKNRSGNRLNLFSRARAQWE